MGPKLRQCFGNDIDTQDSRENADQQYSGPISAVVQTGVSIFPDSGWRKVHDLVLSAGPNMVVRGPTSASLAMQEYVTCHHTPAAGRVTLLCGGAGTALAVLTQICVDLR